jgi:integrase/recombinase XerD
MMTFTELAPAASEPPGPFTDRLRLAVAAYLARFKGSSRAHTESDLRCYLAWCAERGLDPLAAQRPHLELYIRWMQEIRRFKPSTVSRRFSVVAGFYHTCVLDELMQHSPAEHVRRPAVPAESPTLGFTHLQFEALLTAARESTNPCDFALVAMLGLLGLRIFEATSANIADLGEEHGHRVLRVCGKGGKVVQIPLPPAVGRAIDRATGRRDRGPLLLNRRGTRMDRHAATRRLRRLAQATGLRTRIHPHMLRHTFVICTAFSTRGTTKSGACRIVPHKYSVLGEARATRPVPVFLSSLLLLTLRGSRASVPEMDIYQALCDFRYR